MQQPSPRQYFETRLRKLPIHKCLVNKDWEIGKMANVMVLRRHVNGNVSGATFLMDLLCLGVKDVDWFFNTEPEDITGMLADASPHMIEIPYALAHNIVYAGLEFAAEYEIKPHADFAIAKYALEEDDDSIELIEIETGEDDIPHLMERYPGQYADAHAKLKKHAGEGNYKVTVGIGLEDEDDWVDEEDEVEDEVEVEDEWEEEEDQEDEEDWEDDDEDFTMSLKDIEMGQLTLLDALCIEDEELFEDAHLNPREELEELKLNTTRSIRLLEIITVKSVMSISTKEEIDLIHEKTEFDLAYPVAWPNGIEPFDFAAMWDEHYAMTNALVNLETNEKSAIILQHVQKNKNDHPMVVVHCLLHLLLETDGPALYETIHDEILPLRHIPMVALAQSFLVTSAPDQFNQGTFFSGLSPSLKEVLTDCSAFSDDEYCLFYALRCLEAIEHKELEILVTWYRLFAETNEADAFMPVIACFQQKLMPIVQEEMMRFGGEKIV